MANYTNSSMQQSAAQLEQSNSFGKNGWSYTFSLSEKPDNFLTTLTVYRRLGKILDAKQIEVGHVDLNSFDLLSIKDRFEYSHFVAEHVKSIVHQYEQSEMLSEIVVDRDQWYKDQASREVLAEYAGTLASLGVNTSQYSSTGMQAIVDQQARLLKAQAENSPNVGFLASELSAMKHSFAATARQEAQQNQERLYPGRLSTPLGRERSANVERLRQRARERDQVRRDAERSNVERYERESLRQAQQREYERVRNVVRQPFNNVIKTKPLVEEKVRQTDLFEDTGRKFRID